MINHSAIGSCVVSFIIPSFKGKNYIQKCVSTIMRVQWNKEIIIVDDGSPDDSFQFYKKVYGQNKEVFVYRKENGGVATARNYGMMKAKGRYLVFIDQDDTVNPIVIEKAISRMDEGKYQILFWDTQRILEDGTILQNTHSEHAVSVQRAEIIEDTLPAFLYGKQAKGRYQLGPLWGAIFRSDFVKSNALEFKSFVSYEDDHLFIFDALSNADNIFFLPEVGYYWAIRSSSVSHQPKIVRNIVEKTLQSYDYRLTRFLQISSDDVIQNEYRVYVEQMVILSSICNVCNYKCWNRDEIKKIRKLLYEKNFIESFANEKLMSEDRLYRLLYAFLRRKQDNLAYMLSFVVSIYIWLKKVFLNRTLDH